MIKFAFNQTFETHDLVVIALLVLLEGVLSIDNALVLGLLAKRLPKAMQGRALTYGLIGAFVFRLIAIATATYLLRWRIVKLLGGGYLVYVAVRHLFFESKETDDEQITLDAKGHPDLRHKSGEPLTTEEEDLELQERMLFKLPKMRYKFWSTVAVIELTDIAFAVDSILAAIALVPTPPGHREGTLHPKLWVVVTGGMLGVILMRIAAVIFIKLLQRFPRFEISAYLLVAVIGCKLLVDWGFNTKEDPHRINFHDTSHPEFWIFWALMLLCFLVGFLPQRNRDITKAET